MKPLVRIPGGKRRISSQIISHVPLPDHGCIWYEPFCGSAAVAIDVWSKGYDIVLGDANTGLMNLYQVLKNEEVGFKKAWVGLATKYNALDNQVRGEQYYYLRSRYNTNLRHSEDTATRIEAAIIFLLINQAGFNGLMRENLKGDINVPLGKTAKGIPKKVLPYDKLGGLSFLRSSRVNILPVGDWSTSVQSAKGGDVVYADPPYANSDNGKQVFRQYIAQSPSDWASPEFLYQRLATLPVKAVAISNSDSLEIHSMSKKYGYEVHNIYANRSISRDSDGRKIVKEVVSVKQSAT